MKEYKIKTLLSKAVLEIHFCFALQWMWWNQISASLGLGTQSYVYMQLTLLASAISHVLLIDNSRRCKVEISCSQGLSV